MTACCICLYSCMPRNNPYDPGNPHFVIPSFSCSINLYDDVMQGPVTDATIIYRFKDCLDTVTTDTGSKASIVIYENSASARLMAQIIAVFSATHRVRESFPVTLTRDGKDTLVMLHDMRIRPVDWDTLQSSSTGKMAFLVWNCSLSDAFFYYRLLRTDPRTALTDTLVRSFSAADTLYSDTTVSENYLYSYRVDVIATDGFIASGRELAVAIPNRPPDPSIITGITADFFMYLGVRWTKNSESDFSRYTLLRSDDSLHFASVFSTDNITDTFWLDTTLSETAQHYYYYLETMDTGRRTAVSPIVSGINQTAVEKELIFIAGGTFTMGRNGNSGVPLNQKPAHEVYLSPYLIDKYETTVGDFCRFLNDYNGEWYSDSLQKCGIYRKNNVFIVDSMRIDHPVTWISWSQADRFCKWAGGELPTEAQWEKAARGIDERLYPWGNSFYSRQAPPDYFLANYVAGFVSMDDSGYSFDGARYTAPVGNYSSGASPFGLMDMTGNVSEWCYDWYANSFPSDSVNPTGASLGIWRSYRGGSFKNYPEEMTSTYRARFDPSEGKDDLGCRCAYKPK